MPLVLRQHRITVASAGTPKELNLAPLKTPSAIVTADPNNVGMIHIGDENVLSSTDTGAPLQAGENVELKGVEYEATSEEIQLKKIFVDAENNGEAVIVSYFDRIQDIGDDFINEKSLLFDGVDEYVNVGNDNSLDLSTAITVSCWIQAASTPATDMVMAAKWDPTGDNRSWLFGAESTNDKLRMLISADGLAVGIGNDKEYQSSITILDGTWHQVAFTFTANILKLYIDGVEDTSVNIITDDVVNTLFSTPSTDTLIGAFNPATPSFFMDGNIDEVSIWNRVLTDAEINEIYNVANPANLGAHSAFGNLVSWWRMGDNDTIPTIRDVVGVNNGTTVNMESEDIVSDTP